MKSTKNKAIAFIFLMIFVLAEYVYMGRIEAITGYADYYFEVFWVIGILVFFKNFFWFSSKKIFRGLAVCLLLGALGAWVQILAFQSGLAVPFDMESKETILFLLLIGPVLEEFLFHLGIWKLVETFISARAFLIVLTAAVFSYSHFRMIDHLPPSVHDFVKYQTIYTFALGLACGWLRSSYGITVAILGHMLFNLGFWLAR